MVPRLIAKLHAGQVLLAALALAVLSATAVRSAGLLRIRRAEHGPRLLAALAVNLLPIGHEYRGAAASNDAPAPMVLTERFVLAVPSHARNGLAFLRAGWSPGEFTQASVSPAIYHAISPRSPPLV